MVYEQFGDSVEDMPGQYQQYYYYQKIMISLVAGDKDTARGLIEKAIEDNPDQGWNGKQIYFMTLSSVLQREAGNAELAEQRLTNAERAVRRARINGMDNADIYYTESSIHALRGEPVAALDSLQSAYNHGFREAWTLKTDLRLESLHQEPQFVAIKQKIERDIAQARSEVETLTIAAL
jgi:tetratricopeptide (TPR) repeat protein